MTRSPRSSVREEDGATPQEYAKSLSSPEKIMAWALACRTPRYPVPRTTTARSTSAATSTSRRPGATASRNASRPNPAISHAVRIRSSSRDVFLARSSTSRPVASRRSSPTASARSRRFEDLLSWRDNFKPLVDSHARSPEVPVGRRLSEERPKGLLGGRVGKMPDPKRAHVPYRGLPQRLLFHRGCYQDGFPLRRDDDDRSPDDGPVSGKQDEVLRQPANQRVEVVSGQGVPDP